MIENVILVNQQDEIIGEAEKITAHQEGLLHRAFSVFVCRRNQQHQLEILLQQRHMQKYHSGGLWTNTCCSHPFPGEEVSMGASRRLFQEMGLSIPLTVLGKFYYYAHFENGLSEHEWDYVLIGLWSGETISIDPREAQAYQWVTLENLRKDLTLNPQFYTAWLTKALDFIVNKQDVIMSNLCKGSS